MDIYEAIEQRRSVRAFRQDPINDEILLKILEAVRLAPSAHNSQEYKFIVVKDSDKKKELAKASNQSFISEAPLVIVGVSLNPKHIMTSGVPAYAVDVAVAMDHLTLAASSEGLGTCWIGSFSQDEIRKILSIPVQYKVVALMPVGVPYDEPSVKSRKSLKDLICRENFSN
ncbi:MAG: nitroreductase family protein [Candidatus Pacebacteria bacterium]|nr:nitroreductase family protein [Candidatus Paceibacterota bacterium]